MAMVVFGVADPVTGFAQSANNPGYFMPPAAAGTVAGNGTPAIVSNPVGQASPVVDSNLIDNLPAPTAMPSSNSPPWYETDWGVAGIGVAATGVTMIFDHGINQFANTKLSYKFRTKVALRVANILELAPLEHFQTDWK